MTKYNLPEIISIQKIVDNLDKIRSDDKQVSDNTIIGLLGSDDVDDIGEFVQFIVDNEKAFLQLKSQDSNKINIGTDEFLDLGNLLIDYKSNLQGLVLNGAEISQIDLTGADLTGAKFGKTRLYEVNLEKSILKEAFIDNSALYKVNLVDADLTNSSLLSSKCSDIIVRATGFEHRAKGMFINDTLATNIRVSDDLGVSMDNLNLVGNKKGGSLSLKFVDAVIDSISGTIGAAINPEAPKESQITPSKLKSIMSYQV